MILSLAVIAWIVLLSLVAGLCAAARAGDLAQPASARRARRKPTGWESFERAEIVAHANPRAGAAAGPGSSLLRGDGVPA